MDNQKAALTAESGFVQEEPVVTHKEWMFIQKLRMAHELAVKGHRSRMEIMFYDGGKSCDITIEDRERVVERMVDRDMK